MDSKKENVNPVNPGLVLYWTRSTTSVHVCWRNRRGKQGFLALSIRNTVLINCFLKWVFPHWSSALQRNEPRASGPPSGTSKLALCCGKLITTLLFLSWIAEAPKLNRWTWTFAFTYGKWRFLLAHVLPEPKITLFSGLLKAWITWLYWTLSFKNLLFLIFQRLLKYKYLSQDWSFFFFFFSLWRSFNKRAQLILKSKWGGGR